MCCLYYYDHGTIEDVERIVGKTINSTFQGDVHPTDQALIITGNGNALSAEDMRWGFLGGVDRKQLMINARAESALEKKSFSESALRRRCIIPAKHFYEWDAQKNKATFTWDESSSLYMAGFWNYFGAESRFIILTTEANDSMRKVHDRMPLIFPENQIKDWIHEDGMVRDFLAQPSPMLSKYQEYEQLTLW